MVYEILYAITPRDLIELVNEYIQKGWKPQGGVCYEPMVVGSLNGGRVDGRFWQAMVKKSK